jgi:hypothetical protein
MTAASGRGGELLTEEVTWPIRKGYPGFNMGHFHRLARRQRCVGFCYAFVKKAPEGAGLVLKHRARGHHDRSDATRVARCARGPAKQAPSQLALGQRQDEGSGMSDETPASLEEPLLETGRWFAQHPETPVSGRL